MRLPTWEEMESVDEQLDVLEHPLDEPLFVAGPPGSGKTVLATTRAQAVAEHSHIVLLTYNRMLRRLFSLLNDKKAVSMIINTMQSYVWGHYNERTGHNPPRLPRDKYAYIWADMFRELERCGAQPDVPHLIVDEGQDLAEEFFAYAARYISRTMSVFADDDQALAERHATLEQIKQAADLPDPIILSQNHRNTPEIARVAEHFHSGRLPTATVRRAHSGDVPRLAEHPTFEDVLQSITTWSQNRGGSIGVVVDQNSTGEHLHTMVRRQLPRLRCDIYTFKKTNENRINVLEPGITILNKESIKGQEFDTVFVLELQEFLPCHSDADKRAMYMMCSRARDNLWLICGPHGRLSPAILNALPDADILERS